MDKKMSRSNLEQIEARLNDQGLFDDVRKFYEEPLKKDIRALLDYVRELDETLGRIHDQLSVRGDEDVEECAYRLLCERDEYKARAEKVEKGFTWMLNWRLST